MRTNSDFQDSQGNVKVISKKLISFRSQSKSGEKANKQKIEFKNNKLNKAQPDKLAIKVKMNKTQPFNGTEVQDNHLATQRVNNNFQSSQLVNNLNTIQNQMGIIASNVIPKTT